MRVCILGGGTAGWMTASALSKKLNTSNISITLVESEEIGTVGVGEATLPHIRFFNQDLEIDEAEFIRKTEATIKLGIEFKNWGNIGDSYIHPFGDFGTPIFDLEFYQHWLRLKDLEQTKTIYEYAYGCVAAKNNKFQNPEQSSLELERSFGYAYQFDSSLYAKFLREFAQKNGVRRVEGKVAKASQDSDGNIAKLILEDGNTVEADIFIDCSGFRGILIEQTLNSGYQDWSNWLPCDRAIAVPCESNGVLTPYTTATALDAGWQWRIPLQHRTGNGHVYWSEFKSDDEAEEQLISNLDGALLAAPKRLRFQAGRRNHFWKNNVIAIGLSSGFLEPLESTSIHLIQEGIRNLLELFPVERSSQLNASEYNNRMALQYERIRDFLLLHYVATERNDSPMWRHFRSLTLPDSLSEKMELWRQRAYIQRYEFGTFLPPSWVAVLIGQNIIPNHYDPRADNFELSKVINEVNKYNAAINNSVNKLPSHQAYLLATSAASSALKSRVERV